MRRNRPSILHAMAAVCLVGVGLGALRSGTFAWFRGVYAITMVLLLIAVVASRYRPGREGAFWFGSSVFGWGFALLGIAPWQTWANPMRPNFRTYEKPTLNPLLWSSGWIEAYATSRPDVTNPPVLPAQSGVIAYERYKAELASFQERRGAVIGITHLLFTWLVALIGGAFGVAVSRPAERDGADAEAAR